jgi:alpha-L-fucosidase
MKTPILISLLLASIMMACQVNVEPPAPYGALPSERQLAWHEMETYAFLHFTTNTFTDKEWGYGDEDPSVFNPTDFNAEQIIGTLAQAGFTGAILTAKHHDGFCLWPSAFTEHSVKNSPWKEGKGDVVREISDACKKYGIKFGIYLSPWDRNYPGYGTEEYPEYYRKQLTELLSNYGDIFEVWWDGANGGDGYYGGAREVRRIDRSVYYGFEQNIQIVRNLQPNAVIFSDAGPDLRWVGNERGFANDSCWATYTPLPREGESVAVAGTTQYWFGETGTENGKYWMPAEIDVSIRPGWFYHDTQDSQVKSLEHLLDIYFHSVGNGGSLLLNVPPDRTGQIHKTDSMRLMEFKAYLDKAFQNDLLPGSNASAKSTRGRMYQAKNLIDQDPKTYWATPDEETQAIIEIELEEKVALNCLLLQEFIELGQRVNGFDIEIDANGEWVKVADGTTIGYKKIIRFDLVETDKIRVNITSSLACPVLSKLSAYNLTGNQH